MAIYKQADYEALRRRCVELKQAGWRQADIARAFGLTAGWVSQTLKTYREQGEAGLTTGKRTGVPSRLTADQLDQLTEELAKGAEQHGFSGQIWTRPRINEVITKLFGVSYDPSQVGRLLKKVGWSRQKPARQARHRTAERHDPQAVANWQPSGCLRSKKAQTEGRTILYVDESAARRTACYLFPFVAHSWAPRGQTPLLLEQAGRAHLSLIAPISPTGHLYLAGKDQPFNGEDICWFLSKLCWQYRRQNMLALETEIYPGSSATQIERYLR